MKASRQQMERALDGGSPDIRFFLLHGPDESQSRELAARLGKRLGAEAERVDLSGAGLKADPARLADEAASISLFGGPRYIRVEPVGDDAIEAVTALLETPAPGNPVVLLAGALRKESKLLRLALTEATALAFASYLPEGSDMDRLAGSMARDHGLRLDPETARRLATATGGDRALLAREIEKLALYVDATIDSPATLDDAAYDALSAGAGEGDLSRLINAVLGGHGGSTSREIARLAVEGIDGIALLRPILRRLLSLAQLRAQVDAGDSVESVMATAGRGIFWKDKAPVSAQVARWTAAMLATAIDRVATLERAVKSSGSAGAILVEAELFTIMRVAAARAR